MLAIPLDWQAEMGDSELNQHDFENLEQVGKLASAMHDQPDAGLWEFCSRQEVHTYSAIVSRPACDRLASVAAHLGNEDRAIIRRERAKAIAATIEQFA